MNKETIIKNDNLIQVGSNIRKIRVEKGIRPCDLVREVNLLGVDLNGQMLSKIESNTQHIKASQFKAISIVLGCNPMDLLL